MLTMMKKLSRRELPEFRRHLLSALLESLLIALPYGIILLVLAQLLRPEPDTTILALCCLSLVLVFILRWLVTRYHFSTTSTFGYRTGRDIRLRLAEHLHALPMGTLEKWEAGKLHTIAMQDTEYAEQIFSHLYAQILITACLTALMLAGLALESWRLALALALPLPLAAWLSWRLAELGRQQGKTLLDAMAWVNSCLIEYLNNIPLLRAFNLAGTRFGRLDDAMRHHAHQAVRMELMAGLSPVAFIMVLQLGLPLLLLTGQQQLLDSQLEIATFLLFLVITPRFFRPLTQLAIFGAELSFMAQAARRIEELLDEPGLPHDESPTKPFDIRQPIRFRQVDFAYQKTPVLQDISLGIQPGTVTALVGPSGSGKTTLVRLVARFWDASSGEIHIGGQPIQHWSQAQLLAHISIVFQEVYLFEDSVLNNLRAGRPELSEQQVIDVCKAANCHDFIMALPDGYQTWIGESGGTLSGGEKQRLAIARAILKDAPIVLLDEASAALDPENELEIQQALNRLTAGKTVIMIAHKLRTIRHADQILVLEGGRIVERGQHEALLSRHGLYARLWRGQMEAQGWQLGTALANPYRSGHSPAW